MQAGAVWGGESLKVAEFWRRAIAGVELSKPTTHRHTIMRTHRNACTHTLRQSPMGDNRKTNSNTTDTAAGSKRQWVSLNDVMGSPPLQQSMKASLFSEWILGIFLTVTDPKPPNLLLLRRKVSA